MSKANPTVKDFAELFTKLAKKYPDMDVATIDEEEGEMRRIIGVFRYEREPYDDTDTMEKKMIIAIYEGDSLDYRRASERFTPKYHIPESCEKEKFSVDYLKLADK